MTNKVCLATAMHKNILEAGCDEAGRGCVAGPVFAAAVILPSDFENDKLTDSKKLTPEMRKELRDVIERKALAYAVGVCSVDEIDKMNILWASVEAMHRAISGLTVAPEHILVDGNSFKPYKEISYTCVIGGDAKYLSIAAASVLAKTYRDDFMSKLHEEYPEFGWIQNKGYPTKKHREAIEKYGVTTHHRRSFKTVKSQLKLRF